MDISNATCYLLKQNTTVLHVTKEQRLCNLQFLVSVDDEVKRAFLTVLLCDKRSIATKVYTPSRHDLGLTSMDRRF